MFKKIIILALFGQFWCTNALFSQDYFDDDFGLWLGVKTNWKLNKTLSFQCDAQTRFSNNAASLNRNSIKTGLELRLHKNIRMLAGALFSEKYKSESALSRYRPYIGAQLRYSMRQWKLRYRNLVQQQSPFNASYPAVLRDRNQLTLIFNYTKRWDLSLSYEIYTDLTGKINTPFVSRQRFAFEIIYHLSKHIDLSPYFLVQRFYSYNGQPERNFITGFTLTIER